MSEDKGDWIRVNIFNNLGYAGMTTEECAAYLSGTTNRNSTLNATKTARPIDLDPHEHHLFLASRELRRAADRFSHQTGIDLWNVASPEPVVRSPGGTSRSAPPPTSRSYKPLTRPAPAVVPRPSHPRRVARPLVGGGLERRGAHRDDHGQGDRADLRQGRRREPGGRPRPADRRSRCTPGSVGTAATGWRASGPRTRIGRRVAAGLMAIRSGQPEAGGGEPARSWRSSASSTRCDRGRPDRRRRCTFRRWRRPRTGGRSRCR